MFLSRHFYCPDLERGYCIYRVELTHQKRLQSHASFFRPVLDESFQLVTRSRRLKPNLSGPKPWPQSGESAFFAIDWPPSHRWNRKQPHLSRARITRPHVPVCRGFRHSLRKSETCRYCRQAVLKVHWLSLCGAKFPTTSAFTPRTFVAATFAIALMPSVPTLLVLGVFWVCE